MVANIEAFLVTEFAQRVGTDPLEGAALLGLDGKDTLNSRDGVNRNDTVNGGAGDDKCVTDNREAEIRSC